jgi:hypothetical protein
MLFEELRKSGKIENSETPAGKGNAEATLHSFIRRND